MSQGKGSVGRGTVVEVAGINNLHEPEGFQTFERSTNGSHVYACSIGNYVLRETRHAGRSCFAPEYEPNGGFCSGQFPEGVVNEGIDDGKAIAGQR